MSAHRSENPNPVPVTAIVSAKHHLIVARYPQVQQVKFRKGNGLLMSVPISENWKLRSKGGACSGNMS